MNQRFLIVFSLATLSMFGMEPQHEKLLEVHQLVFVKAFLNEKFKASYEQTTFTDRRKLEFHGIKIPVFIFTLNENEQTDAIAGCILEDARPTTWAGLWYNENAVSINRVFLKTPWDDHFKAQILARSTRVIFRASSLIVEKNTTKSILAVLWTDQGNTRKLFFTLSNLGSLDYTDPIIDLDKNREEIALG